MVTTLPRTHIVMMGMERLVPTFADLELMANLLPRSATGQKLTTYMNVITGARREGEVDGAREMHVVILDNGRSRQLGDAGVPVDLALHSLRRVPERVPGVSADRRSRLWFGVLGADRRGAHAALDRRSEGT